METRAVVQRAVPRLQQRHTAAAGATLH